MDAGYILIATPENGIIGVDANATDNELVPRMRMKIRVEG
jgi:hypothetical protein